MTKADTHTKELHDLVAKELECHGVVFGKDTWLASPPVLAEISHILAPELHEGRIAPCGIVFTERPAELANTRKVSLPVSQLVLARRLADGINSFMLFERENFLGLIFFSTAMSTELQLVRVLPQSNSLIIQRDADGVSKFFRPDSITLHENRTWFTKPHVKEAARRIYHCVAGIDRAILKRILEFAFHILSPASRSGATLVWYFQTLATETKSETTPDQDLTGLQLSILDERDSAAVCHFLSQIDGATILGPDGRLMRTSVHLRYSQRSSELIPEYKGTRHTSAQRFSFDDSRALVIAVSEDGPVTVFSDGASIADLRIYSSKHEARFLKKSATPERKEDITSRSFEHTCKRCGKLARIEEVKVQGCKDTQAINCPTCLTQLYTSVCFTLKCRPFKRVESQIPAI